MADRELALEFQSHHEEEDREERIVDPIQHRHPEGGSAEHESELGMPQSTEIGAERRIDQCDVTIDASSNENPAEGAQRANVRVAVRTRCPKEPSIASVNELSSQGPS